MSREEMDTLAYQAHVDGFNCAESVLLSAVRVLGLGPQGLTPRIASCFGGGVGRTHSEICGALTGALMALGLAHGRDNPTEPRERIYALTVELRQRFLDAHGSTQVPRPPRRLRPPGKLGRLQATLRRHRRPAPRLPERGRCPTVGGWRGRAWLAEGRVSLRGPKGCALWTPIYGGGAVLRQPCCLRTAPPRKRGSKGARPLGRRRRPGLPRTTLYPTAIPWRHRSMKAARAGPSHWSLCRTMNTAASSGPPFQGRAARVPAASSARAATTGSTA